MKRPKQYTPEEARQYAAGLCAGSEQCEFDLRRKLSSHGVYGVEADRIIDFLTGHDFINEGRYARAFARDKARFSRWGKMKIRMALAAKRISSRAVAEALEAIDKEDYDDGLDNLVRRFAAKEDLRDRDSRVRLIRRLCARGFELSHIHASVRKVMKETEE